MNKICDYKDCTGCTACANICKHNAIKMQEDNDGFLRPIIDNALCINCGLCNKVCPSNHTYKNTIISTIICRSKDNDTVITSSSGGIFTELCKAWCKNKDSYYIYGAAIIDGEVKHIGVNDIKNAWVFKGSKYVQSDIRDTFKEIKTNLDKGNHVLFSGTPCQVAGLRSFLHKDYDKLFCIDLVCHGVPSPKVFKNYQSYLEKKYSSKIINLSFVKKINGWINKYFYVEFENKQKYKKLAMTNDDPYMALFFSHYSLRPSCENCHYTNTNRVGDITLSDAWGVEKLHPDFNFIDGASMVMCSSQKGLNLYNKIKENIFYIEDSVEKYYKFNPQLVRSVSFAKNRNTILTRAVSPSTYYALFDSEIKLRPSYIRFLSELKWKIRYKLKQYKIKKHI